MNASRMDTPAVHAKTTARLGLKLVGVFVLVCGLLVLCEHLTMLLGDLFTASLLLPDETLEHLSRVLVGVPLTMGIGAYLVFGGKWLAGRIAPDNRPRCPECEYGLTGLTSDQCPECGASAGIDARSTCKPAVRVVIKLMGVALIALMLQELLCSAIMGAWSASNPGERSWYLANGFAALVAIVLGAYLLSGAAWLLNYLVPGARASRQQAGPECQVDEATSDHAPLVRALVKLVGICLLIPEVSWFARNTPYFLGRIARTSPSSAPLAWDVLELVGLVLRLAIAGWLIFRARWLIARLLSTYRRMSSETVTPTMQRSALMSVLLALLGVYLTAVGVAEMVVRGGAAASGHVVGSLYAPGPTLHELFWQFCPFARMCLGVYLLSVPKWLVCRTAGTVVDRTRPTAEVPVCTTSHRAWVWALLRLLGVYLCVVAVADGPRGVHRAIEAMHRPSSIHVGVVFLAVVAFVELALGLYLLLGGASVVNVLVPVDRRYCANCGYELRGPTGERCSECDAALPMTDNGTA